MAHQPEQDLQPLLDVQQNQLSVVLGQGDSIDNKVLALLASNIAVLIYILQASFTLGAGQWVVLLAPFAGSLVFNALALKPRPYIGAGVSMARHAEYLTLPREALLLQLLADTAEAIRYNKQLNATGWTYCVLSFWCTMAGVVALGWMITVQ